MASSGNFTTSKYNNKIGLKLSWTSSKDVTNNRTLIKWTLTSSGGSTGNWWMAGPVTATINGTKVVNTTSRFKLYGGGKYKKTGSIYVAHNTDGTKSVSMSVKAAIYSSSVNCTGSKTYTLDKIDRYAYITGGTTTFSNEDYPTINYANPLGSEIVKNLRLRILWNNDTEYTDWAYVGDETESYTFTSEILTDANKASMMALSPSGDDIPLKYDLASTMGGVEYHSYYNGTMVIGTVEPTIRGMTYFSQIQEIVNVMGNATDLLVSPGGTLFKFNTAKFTIHFDSIKASAGAKIKSVGWVYGDYFNRKMDDPLFNRWNYFRRTFSESEQQYELTNYSLTDMSYAEFKAISNGWIDSPETGVNYPALGVIVVDTRGKVLKTYLPLSLFSYSYPSAQISLSRRANFYSETDVKVSCMYSDLKNPLDQPRNLPTIKCLYKKTSDASYNEVVLYDGVQSTLNLDNKYSWDVIIAIKDSITSIIHDASPTREDTPEWVQYHYIVNAGTPILFIDKMKRSVGVNCLPALADGLEVNGADVSNMYSLKERCVGFWIDGSPIYEKTIFLDSAVTISSGGNYSVPTSIWSQKGLAIDIALYCHNQNNDHYVWRWVTAGIGLNTGALKLYNGRASTLLFDGFTIRYTKEPITP